MSYPDPQTPEPLTEVYRAFMGGYRTHPVLATIVKPGDFVDQTKPVAPARVRNATGPAGLPQLLLMFGPYRFDVKNSIAWGYTLTLYLRTQTEGMGIGQLARLRWAITQATAALHPKLNLTHVEGWRVIGGSGTFGGPLPPTPGAPSGEKPKPRWRDVLEIRVLGAVSKSVLRV